MDLNNEELTYIIRNSFETHPNMLRAGADELFQLTKDGHINPLIDGLSLARVVNEKEQPNAEWLLKLVFELSGKNWESVKENAFGVIPSRDEFVGLKQQYKAPNGKEYNLLEKYLPKHIAEVLKLMQADYLEFLNRQSNIKIKPRPGLIIQSGFRSNYYQASVFARLVAEKGLDYALKFSMLPGRSQHADFKNMAVDINSMGNEDGEETGFQNTLEFKWLLENAKKFGFWFPYFPNPNDLSKEVGQDGVAVEPWHIQYLGVDEARMLMSENKVKELFKGKYNL
jgi:LAS superfamily LD-carboxypeptidase LdcB